MSLLIKILKLAGILAARLASKTVLTANGYIGIVSLINRQTQFKFQDYLSNSLEQAQWPDKVLARARRVTLPVSNEPKIFLYPHAGEFDFHALLGGQLRYEKEVFSLLDRLLGKHDYVIEVGANVGVFTVWMERRLRACPKIKGIFAFEPSLEAFRRLIKNCAANDCRRVSLINMALSDKPGVLSFFEPSGHLTNGSFSKSFAELFSDDVKETYVAVGTGSMIEMLINCGDSMLFKLDAEGHEAAVILGLAPLFSKANVDLLIEVLPPFEENILSALTAVCEHDQPLRVGERDRLFKCRPKIGDVGSACSVQR